MKKIILTLSAIFAFGFANAQDKTETSGPGFSEGNVYLTGTAAFASSKTGDAKTDGFTLSPGMGYFVTSNIAIEGQVSYTSTKDNNTGVFPGLEVKQSGFGVAAGAKYFFTPASKFSLSLGANISYQNIKTEVESLSGDVKSKIIGVNIPVGLHYFVSDSFAITSTWGGFGYSSNDNGGDGAEKTNDFNLGLDASSISFGLLYKL